MVVFMEKAVVAAGDALTPEERNLLSVAYSNAVAARLSSWRVISSLIEPQEAEATDLRFSNVRGYLDNIKSEISSVCDGILHLLNSYLIINNNSTTATNPESSVFYWEMRGDYYRYLVEIRTGSEKEDAKDSARDAYEEAKCFAKSTLAPTNLIRLGLALNMTTFYAKIMQIRFIACMLAEEALVSAKEDLENENSKEVDRMIRLLG